MSIPDAGHTTVSCYYRPEIQPHYSLAAMDKAPVAQEVISAAAGTRFDARHNTPRIGRILMARGRDATDVALATSFGPCTLAGFKVIPEEVGCTTQVLPWKASRA
jgi:hypothetical protein